MAVSRSRRLVYAAMGAALIAVCSLISVPAAIPFTLQTFAVLLVADVLGGAAATLSVLVYLLLGAVGIPVFASFRGGLGVLTGPTGGYLIGFLFSTLAIWGIRARWGERPAVRLTGMIVGMLLCYAFGTAWFVVLQGQKGNPLSVGAALSLCVLPYLLPDAIKTALAFLLGGRIRTALKIQ